MRKVGDWCVMMAGGLRSRRSIHTDKLTKPRPHAPRQVEPRLRVRAASLSAGACAGVALWLGSAPAGFFEFSLDRL